MKKNKTYAIFGLGRYGTAVARELVENGKEVILATPSGARPTWLAQKYPEVLRVEENEYYGKFIMIEHSKNLVSLYGHLNEQKVLPGDIIKTGATIGLSGSTGKSTGPHLHFEIRKDGKCVNPEDYLL